jgi:hypothetical protein
VHLKSSQEFLECNIFRIVSIYKEIDKKIIYCILHNAERCGEPLHIFVCKHVQNAPDVSLQCVKIFEGFACHIDGQVATRWG